MEPDPITHHRQKLAAAFRGLLSPSQGESLLVIFGLSWAHSMLDLQFTHIITLFYIWLEINRCISIWESINCTEHSSACSLTQHLFFFALFLICHLFPNVSLLVTVKIWVIVVLFNFFFIFSGFVYVYLNSPN